MSTNQPVPTPENPTPKGFSKTDVQALGLIALILMVINLPLYHSVLPGHGKQAPRLAAAAPAARMKTASAKDIVH